VKFRPLAALAAAACLAAGLSTAVHAQTRKKDLDNQSTFEAADAIKGRDYVEAAMTTPMLDLLKQADVTRPAIMLEYGLALELGRPSVSSQLSEGDRDKLKRGFRDMLDLYLNSSDKFGKVTFKEDSMLDLPEFWILLAEHIGRPKRRVDAAEIAQLATNGRVDTSSMMFIPDTSEQDKEFNLNADLVLNRQVVNAATTCVESAMGFARMRKIQTVAASETNVTPEQFAQARDMAARNYRLAYQEGILGCGDRDYFMKVVDVASHNLGHLGELKDDPNAQPVDLSLAPTK